MEKYSCQYFFHFHPKKSPVSERANVFTFPRSFKFSPSVADGLGQLWEGVCSIGLDLH